MSAGISTNIFQLIALTLNGKLGRKSHWIAGNIM